MNIGTLDTSFPQSANVYLWQYANAHNLNFLLTTHFEWFKSASKEFWSDWHADVFNLDTANSFGLEVWGRVLGVKRPSSKPQNFAVDRSGVLRFYNVNDDRWHSIWLVGDTPENSGEGNPPANIQNPPGIAVEIDPPTDLAFSAVPIPDEMYRRCLKARLFMLCSNYSVSDINKYLNYLFPGRGVYVRDNRNMTMDIIFGYIPSDVELSVITFDDFSPRPAGVLMRHDIALLDSHRFGFEENKLGTWIVDDENEGNKPPIPDGYGTFYNL